MKSQRAQIFWTSVVAIGLAVTAFYSVFHQKPTHSFVESSSSTERLIKDSFEIR